MGRHPIYGKAMSAAERQRRRRERLQQERWQRADEALGSMHQDEPTTILTAVQRIRIIKILGMLGSAHGGERAAAGKKATELLRGCDLTWDDVIVQ